MSKFVGPRPIRYWDVSLGPGQGLPPEIGQRHTGPFLLISPPIPNYLTGPTLAYNALNEGGQHSGYPFLLYRLHP